MRQYTIITLFLFIIYNIYKLVMKDFNEYIFESYLAESILYFSPRFREQLLSMSDNKVASELLSKEGTDIKSEVTLIDISDNDDNYLTFMPIDKAQKLIDYHYPNAEDNDISTTYNQDVNDILWRNRERISAPIYINNSRNSIKIGKFANKVVNGKYSARDIESFVNTFKSSSPNKREKISVVEGKDIEYWYDEKNYLYIGRGSLGMSCMSAKKGLFNIYTDNPDTCKLVILTIGDKLVGRALLWKLNSIKSDTEKIEGKIKSEWFLDRVYSSEDYQIDKIRKWAIDKGYAIRYYNTGIFETTKILYNKTEYKNVKMSVKIKPIDYDKYPYLDTFMSYDLKKGILYNEDKRHLGHLILRDTYGGYTRSSLSRSSIIINRFRDFVSL